MNLLPKVDPKEYLSEIKLYLESSKKDLKIWCSNLALISDLDVLKKSGFGNDYIISITDYISEVDPEAKAY